MSNKSTEEILAAVLDDLLARIPQEDVPRNLVALQMVMEEQWRVRSTDRLVSDNARELIMSLHPILRDGGMGDAYINRSVSYAWRYTDDASMLTDLERALKRRLES